MPSKIIEKVREYQNTAFCNALIKNNLYFILENFHSKGGNVLFMVNIKNIKNETKLIRN